MPAKKTDRTAWHTLPHAQWNVRTVHAMFADLNREHFGVETYLPMRNWSFEQGVIKRALTEHGADVLHEAFTLIFREYKPTPDYPILTAGFAISYRLNTVIPRILADRQRKEKAEATVVNGGMAAGELASWL
ncbi:hypothetical protein H7K28_18040 [Paenibacillus polymyxa]|jgi:hypothetical protein|nr:hypothetical protein [Paenibacillus polymyxa]MBY0056479.1 hypothetical protein [Paenibacillus polymyxa]MBY0071826.1 hypothetical protein [Paenibacillus polymyxa]MBY0080608.1 hypothetical protein [Paenibacillus polymyxa]NUH10775.1 hypothetical protein [Paenibacillus polymyxa]